MKTECYIKIRNNKDTPLDGIYFAIPSEYKDYLSLLSAKDIQEELVVTEVNNPQVSKEHNTSLYFIKFASPIGKNKFTEITTSETYWKRMSFLPK